MNYAAPSNFGSNTARTTYGDDGATTRTTGLSMPGGNDQLLEFFKKLARQRLQPQGAQAGPQHPMAGAHGVTVPQKDRPDYDPNQAAVYRHQADPMNDPVPMHWVDAFNRPDELKPDYRNMSINQLGAFAKANPRGEFSRNDTFGNAGGSM